MGVERLTRAFEQLGRRERERLIAISSLRTTLTVVVLLVIYATLPSSQSASARPSRDSSWPSQFWRWSSPSKSRRSVGEHRQLRAIEAVLTAVTLVAVLVSLLYLGLAQANPASLTKPLDRLTAFCFTVLSTAGFDDITADTYLAAERDGPDAADRHPDRRRRARALLDHEIEEWSLSAPQITPSGWCKFPISCGMVRYRGTNVPQERDR